jgi:hypothetical protein
VQHKTQRYARQEHGGWFWNAVLAIPIILFKSHSIAKGFPVAVGAVFDGDALDNINNNRNTSTTSGPAATQEEERRSNKSRRSS